MSTRRRVLAGFALALAGCAGGGGYGYGGGGGGDETQTPRSPDADLGFGTTAFSPGGTIPTKYTCDGTDVSPPLTLERAPEAAGSLALVVDDPDAPGGTFVHWLLWNLPPDAREIPENVPRSETVDALGGARQGTNDFDEIGYRGPCPPEADDAHTYRFSLHALDRTLDLDPGAERGALRDAMDGHRLALARFAGEYDR